MKTKNFLRLIFALFALTFFTFNFFNLPVAEASNLNAQNVIWTNAVGMNVSGNNLSKTAINNWGNGGASSVQQIISGDGYVEFTTNETNTTKFAGLSKGDPNQDYKQINFALGLNAFGQIYISENTVLKYGPAGSYIPGDIFKMAQFSIPVHKFHYIRSSSILPCIIQALLLLMLRFLATPKMLAGQVGLE